MTKTWLNTMDDTFETPLSRAEHSNHGVLTALMLQQERADRESGLAGSSLLHRSAALGLGRVVEALLSEKVDPDLRDSNGETPLHKAARNGHGDIARMLLDAGANANAACVQGLTPLHWAALTGNAAMTDLLLDACADPLVPAPYLDGLTPLVLARIMGYGAVSQRLAGLAVA